MPRLLIVVSFMLTSIIKGQVLSCDQSSLTVNTTFPPYSTTNYSTNSTSRQCLYLCGPMTTVYDTVNSSGGCRIVLLDSGSVYITSLSNCNSTNYIFAKSKSYVIVQNNSNITANTYKVMLGIGSVLADQTCFCLNPGFCLSMTFPSVNCVVGIYEISNRQSIFKTYPNPASTKINFEFIDPLTQFVDITITNHLGEIVFKALQWPVTTKEILIDNLSNGTYILVVKNKLGQQTEKLVVMH